MDWHSPLGETRIIAKNDILIVSDGVSPQEHAARATVAQSPFRRDQKPAGETRCASLLAMELTRFMTNNPVPWDWPLPMDAFGCTRRCSDLLLQFRRHQGVAINEPVKIAYVDGSS